MIKKTPKTTKANSTTIITKVLAWNQNFLEPVSFKLRSSFMNLTFTTFKDNRGMTYTKLAGFILSHSSTDGDDTNTISLHTGWMQESTEHHISFLAFVWVSAAILISHTGANMDCLRICCSVWFFICASKTICCSFLLLLMKCFFVFFLFCFVSCTCFGTECSFGSCF